MGVAPALVIIVITLIRVFFTSTTLKDALDSLLEFKRNNLADEVRAGCAWLFIAVPCTTLGWDTVEKAAERWRRTARAQLPDRPGYYDELLGSEDSRVHETQG